MEETLKSTTWSACATTSKIDHSYYCSVKIYTPLLREDEVVNIEIFYVMPDN
jgi:hypothetical protein